MVLDALLNSGATAFESQRFLMTRGCYSEAQVLNSRIGFGSIDPAVLLLWGWFCRRKLVLSKSKKELDEERRPNFRGPFAPLVSDVSMLLSR